MIIVEEAGEVLEAHVLSSLQPTTKHLILIGDHQQLRPKLEHYPLTVEAPHHQANFNISMFERLVESGMEHGTLHVRGRPCVCALACRIMQKRLRNTAHHTCKAYQFHYVFGVFCVCARCDLNMLFVRAGATPHAS